MTRNPLQPALLGGAALLLAHLMAPCPAGAHAIESTLERIAVLNQTGGLEKLEIQSSFSTGVPAQDASVRLLPATGGDPIELGRTGVDGRLRFELPAIARAGGEIQVDAGPGHRDYLDLSEIEAVGRPGQASAIRLRQAAPSEFWPWQAPTVLIGLLLVGGAGLWSQRRRKS